MLVAFDTEFHQTHARFTELAVIYLMLSDIAGVPVQFWDDHVKVSCLLISGYCRLIFKTFQLVHMPNLEFNRDNQFLLGILLNHYKINAKPDESDSEYIVRSVSDLGREAKREDDLELDSDLNERGFTWVTDLPSSHLNPEDEAASAEAVEYKTVLTLACRENLHPKFVVELKRRTERFHITV